MGDPQTIRRMAEWDATGTVNSLALDAAHAAVTQDPSVVAAGALLLSRQDGDINKRWMLFGCTTMLAWAALVQIPFSAPIYFCYVTPLAGAGWCWWGAP